MRKFLISALVFFSSIVAGETELNRKVQLPKKDIAESEVKNYQIHNAIWEVILDKSTELKFDSLTLKKVIDERFSSHWTKIKERHLREKYGRDFQLTEEVKNNFFQGLDSRKEEEIIKYLKLSSLVDGLKFKSHELGADGVWTSEVAFKFNQEKLNLFLKRFLSKEEWIYDSLFIIGEIDLINLEWKDLGLEKAEDFVAPLRASWVDLVQQIASVSVKDVEGCRDHCLEGFRNWIKASLVDGSLDADSYFRQGLLLKISYSIKKTGFRVFLGEIDLEWEGKFVLVDGESKKVLFSASIPRFQKSFRPMSQKELNSIIAGHMYKNSKDFFRGLEGILKQSKRFSRLTSLTLTGYSHLGDVLSFMQKLRQEGDKISIDPQIDLFSQKEAKILAFYKGEEKSFTDLLSRLKELKSSQSYKLIIEPSGSGFSLKFVAE